MCKKKSGVIFIQQIIDWQLLVNDEITVDLKNTLCQYEKGKYLIFEEKGITNMLDFENSTYKRIAGDYTMEIDFQDKRCSFLFPTKERCDFAIEGFIKEDDKKIQIKYNYDEEIKKINITLKERK